MGAHLRQTNRTGCHNDRCHRRTIIFIVILLSPPLMGIVKSGWTLVDKRPLDMVTNLLSVTHDITLPLGGKCGHRWTDENTLYSLL